MKDRILILIFLSVFILGGCNNSIKTETVINPNECSQYSCPMHPDKTSVVSAKCPECNMDMEPVIKKNENDSVKTNPNGK